jgi:hypothetical protein
MKTEINDIPFTFAGLNHQGTVPNWARGFSVSRSTVADLSRETRLPEVSIVQSTRPQQILKQGEALTRLFETLVKASDFSPRLILSFTNSHIDDVYTLATILGKTPGLADRIDLAYRSHDLHAVFLEAVTKVLATRNQQDPLSTIKKIVKTGRDLRPDNGRLNTKKNAKVFGLSHAKLARQIRSSPQSISKTPDAKTLQSHLQPYERIARLRTVLSEEEFKVWLNTSNTRLENIDAPIEYLKAGAAEPLASFAENMLTGAPA